MSFSTQPLANIVYENVNSSTLETAAMTGRLSPGFNGILISLLDKLFVDSEDCVAADRTLKPIERHTEETFAH